MEGLQRGQRAIARGPVKGRLECGPWVVLETVQLGEQQLCMQSAVAGPD